MTVMRSSLDSLFRPQSVAVFGASANAGSVGNILMRNLLENPFGGVVFPINPTRRAVQGVSCYPNLAAVGEKVELAVIATPEATVPGVVRDCVEHDVAASIIISAGFAELGAEGRKLEDKIRGITGGKIAAHRHCARARRQAPRRSGVGRERTDAALDALPGLFAAGRRRRECRARGIDD